MEQQRGQDLTQGSIVQQIWSLAWPMMLSIFFYTLYNLVDAYWVSKISPAAIAAVSISQITLFVTISLAMGISVGSAVLVGMALGRKDVAEAERILGQGYLLSLIAAAVFTLLALLFADRLLTLGGATGEIFGLARPYYLITTAGSVLLFVLMNTTTAFNSQGDNFTTTKLFALSTLVNIVLDPIFIFGWGGFPTLGIAGAAWATLISQALFLILALRVLMSPTMMVRLRPANLGLRWTSVKSVMQIGIPASLTQALNPLGFLILTSLVSREFGEFGAAAFSIGFRIEFFAFIPAVGFGFAAMAMMGQNTGAQDEARIDQVIATALRLGCGLALAFGLLVMIFAPWIVGVFTDEAAVTRAALLYFWIVPLGYLFFAATFIQASLLQGYGRSWPGFWITAGRIALTSGLAYLLVLGFSAPIWAVWTSLVVGSVTASLLGFLWLRQVISQSRKTAQSAPPDAHST